MFNLYHLMLYSFALTADTLHTHAIKKPPQITLGNYRDNLIQLFNLYHLILHSFALTSDTFTQGSFCATLHRSLVEAFACWLQSQI